MHGVHGLRVYRAGEILFMRGFRGSALRVQVFQVWVSGLRIWSLKFVVGAMSDVTFARV